MKYVTFRSISPYLPRTLETKLDPQIYEMVLYEYLKYDPQVNKFIKQLSHHLI